ncbi:MAG TPA: activator of (R)-2-hydroxyglutaryl-CoA dehydratase, partial [Patescibacteria group bacterium]|nr:activator of (R)-2-hydroxyglutaryl-CoA dehydratase [Patescibacteria group bacterium]
IETSGEGDVNAHSRVQMALGEAKVKAKNEFQEALSKTGYTLVDIKNYVDENPELKQPFYHIPHYKGMIGVAARFARHVGECMKTGKRHAA